MLALNINSIGLLALAIAACQASLPVAQSNNAVRDTEKEPACVISPVPPKKAICRAFGHINEPKALKIAAVSDAASENECINLCQRRRGPPKSKHACMALAYNEKAKVCHLYEYKLETEGFQRSDQNNHTFWSDLDCYDCPNPCKNQPYYKQLLDNPGFQNSLVGPWYITHGHVYGCHVISPGINSSKLLRISGLGGYTSQYYNACKKSLYRFSFDYRFRRPTNNHSAIPPLTVSTDGLFFRVGGSQYLTRAQFWSYETIQNAGQIQIQTSTSKDNPLDVDNFRIERVPTTFQAAAGARELVQNGGFESGSLAPWTANVPENATLKVVSPGISGQYAAQWSGKLGDEGTLKQVIPVDPSQAYLVSFRLRKNPQGEFPRFTFNDQRLDYYPSQFRSGNELSFSYPYQPVESEARFLFDFAVGTVLLDNVSMKKLDPSQA